MALIVELTLHEAHCLLSQREVDLQSADGLTGLAEERCGLLEDGLKIFNL